MDEQRSLNLYRMTLDEVQAFDCGSRGHNDFPEQQPIPAYKPTLAALVEAVNKREVTTRYNIEIKSSPDWDGVYQPSPDRYVSLVLAEMARLELLDRANVQSFDSRIMEEVRRQAPGVRLAWLVGNEDGFDANMARLSFVPDIYSPHHGLVDSTLVEAVRARGMTLIPWTINDPIRMKELIDLGVDGIITDYPDRVPGSSE